MFAPADGSTTIKIIVHSEKQEQQPKIEKEMIGNMIILFTCLTPTISNLSNVSFHPTSFLSIEGDQICEDDLLARSVSQMINLGS
jgi:hypothetical protein